MSPIEIEKVEGCMMLPNSGSTICVYWPGEGRWFSGIAKRKCSKRGLCVWYHDGDIRYHHSFPQGTCIVEKDMGVHCDTCGKYYASQKWLEKHMRTHAPAAPRAAPLAASSMLTTAQNTVWEKVEKVLQCAICLDILKDPVTTKNCMHSFCKDCLTTSLRVSCKACPKCKQPLVSMRDTAPNADISQLAAIVAEKQ